VDFTVIFSEPVTGVDTTDFALEATGVSDTALSSVSGSGSVYTVTAMTGGGTGTIRLDVVDDDSIVDPTLNPLGGVGAGNGSYTGDEAYDVRFYQTYLTVVCNPE
jgi:MSHA biogenesis protein MshQ